MKELLVGPRANIATGCLNNADLCFISDENQLTFTCHWRCGTVAVSEEPVYELVEIQGTFRKLDTDDCKFLIIFLKVLPCWINFSSCVTSSNKPFLANACISGSGASCCCEILGCSSESLSIHDAKGLDI